MAEVAPYEITEAARTIIASKGRVCSLELATKLKVGPSDVYRALVMDGSFCETAPLMWEDRKTLEEALW